MKSKLVVVDDDPLEAKLIKKGFESIGVFGNWTWCESGQDFIEMLHRGEFNDAALVLLDLKMPLMDGKEVLRTITERKLPKIPIVVFTSSSHQSDINSCYELGANAFVTKPIQREEYLESLNRIAKFWVSLNKRARYDDVN